MRLSKTSLAFMIISILAKGRSFTANAGTKAAILPKGRFSIENSGTQVAVLLGMNRCSNFSLLSALQIVGVLKITPHTYPWLEVYSGKCVLFFALQSYGNPSLYLLMQSIPSLHQCEREIFENTSLFTL